MKYRELIVALEQRIGILGDCGDCNFMVNDFRYQVGKNLDYSGVKGRVFPCKIFPTHYHDIISAVDQG